MSFPDPSLVVPTLDDYQFSYRGLTFGGNIRGAAYQIQQMTIDMPDIATGDVQRALDQGEFAGVDTLPGADITIVQMVRSDSVSVDHAAQALGGIMAPGGSTEDPLWLQLPSGTFCRTCRPRKHNCPLDINRVFMGAFQATSLLHSTDPRWYVAPSVSQTVAIPTSPGGGTPIPAPVPWVLGAGVAYVHVNVMNTGLFESRPVLVFTGPCENPIAWNYSLPDNPYVGVTIILNAGDTLTVDLDWQSAVYTRAGATQGTPVRGRLMSGSTWWNLPANSTNEIAYLAGGTLTIQSASAYLAV